MWKWEIAAYMVLSQNGDSIHFITTRGQSLAVMKVRLTSTFALWRRQYILYKPVTKRFQDFISAYHVCFEFTVIWESGKLSQNCFAFFNSSGCQTFHIYSKQIRTYYVPGTGDISSKHLVMSHFMQSGQFSICEGYLQLKIKPGLILVI